MRTEDMPYPEEILSYWFDTLREDQWWTADPALDADVNQRFGNVLAAARAGELASWRRQMEGRLAEIIILDQFSRMVHRGTARAFENDPMALALAQEAVHIGGYKGWHADWQAFLLMPYMHSESRLIHQDALRLYSAPELAYNLDFEVRHKVVIDRFGRYPHRNALLGRVSTAEEEAFLAENPTGF